MCYTQGIQIAPHLSQEELERGDRQVKDGVERSHHQIIWFLGHGKPIDQKVERTTIVR